jgi:hypothetical protein
MAFRVAFALSLGAMTLHDLIRTMAFEGIPSSERPKHLLEALLELCELNLLKWMFEYDYGNLPGIDPKCYDSATLNAFWEKNIKATTFCIETPDINNPTLFLEPTEELKHEIERDEYEQWRYELGW